MVFQMQQRRIQGMLKEGHKHLSGLDEAVLKNIDACKQLSTITRTSIDPPNIGEFNENHETGRKPRVESHEAQNIPEKKHQLPIESVIPLDFKKDEQTRKKEASIKKQTMLLKPNRPSILKMGVCFS